MADTPKSAPPPAPHVHLPSVIEWSSISQGDLGLKAMYWTDDTKTSVTSLPIVGWISYSNKKVTDIVPINGFAPVVVSEEGWWPALASAVPRYACIASKKASDEDILTRINKWGMGPNPGPSVLAN